jgi:hypothetical protein
MAISRNKKPLFSFRPYLLQDFSSFLVSVFVAALFVLGKHQFLSAESLLIKIRYYFNEDVFKQLNFKKIALIMGNHLLLVTYD